MKRDLSVAVKSWGPYLAAAISFFASSLVLKNYLSGIGDDNILIASNPLNFPLYISLVVVSFYLAYFRRIDIKRKRPWNPRSALLRTAQQHFLSSVEISGRYDYFFAFNRIIGPLFSFCIDPDKFGAVMEPGQRHCFVGFFGLLHHRLQPFGFHRDLQNEKFRHLDRRIAGCIFIHPIGQWHFAAFERQCFNPDGRIYQKTINLINDILNG